MKLRNSSFWPDHFVRRLVSWCCAQLGCSSRIIRSAQFTKYRRHFRGTAWCQSGRILVRCSDGRDGEYPLTTKYPRRIHAPSYILNDAIEALVQVTAHEVAHIEQHKEGLKVHREAWIDSLAIKVLEAFRVDRETLLAVWSEPVIKRVTVKADPVEKRAAKVFADLERWQRKLKLSQTKIRKLKQRARYYDRKQAAKRVEP